VSLGALDAAVPAVLQNFYAGQEGGVVLAELLFGDVSPSGRLPLTYFAAPEDLPDFEDYALVKGRTYMYSRKQPAYPFGHGLGYARMEYGRPQLSAESCAVDGAVVLRLPVRNTGAQAVDEVVQVYTQRTRADRSEAAVEPGLRLLAFQRVHVPAGEAVEVTLELPAARLTRWDERERRFVVRPGSYALCIGSSSAAIQQRTAISVR